MQREVVIVSGVRTAIGKFGGSLKDVPPTELAALVVREVLARSNVAGDQVGHVVFGNVIATEPKDMYMARVAAINGGVSESAPALTVNRLCGSGLQAIISAAQAILLGDADVAIGGGAENMSRAPYITPDARFGVRMGDARLVDMMLGALNDPFHTVPMGITAENVAQKYGITREQQDALAMESHRRAAHAIAEGRFKEQIVPVTRKVKGKEVSFDTDEHVRPDVSLDDLSGMRPAFQKTGGTVTAGNASGINDAAAAVLMMERGAAEQRGVKPLARLVSYAHAGVDPLYMGIGPVPATRIALERAGLSIHDIDVIEANEAFAAQACAVAQELQLDAAKVNPNGSGISLGHPIGATGALITVKALHELKRVNGRFALVTMCIGGGQGIAAIFENLQ
ncbi:Beta-ketothiolase BktB [Paraburkholderia domus]|uniref:Beta-ketothiolase BktB n=1 Tax=Paraburkholderia domus TaxID=2793075 RepID=A0A9N8NAB3_9BURK|nr:beta-ketothiolase BktB [Paraburkholderia domus]MBK5049040.1 acetyl-CoA C-acyltransferase family protein [Burkholderia sp. R-70006]MBK5061249.1 acetyl-CoA C-acyltransferase family protein [Burkholderia sp. R-70199]MBK5086292.1 acetyl-CoA C-acyltransferase family protein [Burkholderia sp. R-69927]MBK5120428.1 acetyl-CoA C-acyltransferase family protein [Burkholderia sp. R-69980]MBK5170089.1 acetyl-CoA C-acyltransferase family protein [Burkholderia sp. R-70211]MBK5179858.1 acetyl-CoA C-acyltr